MSISIGRLRRDRGMSVARPTALGNPFVVGQPYSRAESVARYREWLPRELEQNETAGDQLARIVAVACEGDVTLLCWCAPISPCHAEVVREIVELEIAATRGER